jgi:hypothetical protein
MGQRFRTQGLVVALALALYAAWAEPSTWALLSAYALSLVLASLFDLQRRVALLDARLFLLLLAGLSLPGLGTLVRLYPSWLEQEGLAGLSGRLGDRMQLEQRPALFPRLVVSSHAQTFYVHERPGQDVRLALGTRVLSGEELGEGLYRVHYDPRTHGALEPRGTFNARLTVSGHTYEREMQAVQPLAHPRWLALSPDRLLVAALSEETDELFTVSARGLERRMPVGDGPVDALFLDDTRVLVSHSDDGLRVYDVQREAQLAAFASGAALGRMALSSDGSTLAVAELGARPALLVMDPHTLTLLARVAQDLPIDWLAFGSDASTLVVSTRADASLRKLVRTSTGYREQARLALGRPAVTLARSLDGTSLYVATTDYRADGQNHLGNHFVDDQLLTVRVEPWSVVQSLHTARRTPRQRSPGSVDRGLSPMGIHQARDGSLLLAFAGSEEHWRLSAHKPEPEVVEVGEHGLYAPHGVAELADGTRVLSSPSAGAVLLIDARGELTLLRLAPDDGYLAKHDQAALARRLGERGFYEGTNSGISCQSCHLHADSDQRAHNLGTHGLLPTLSVRGLLGTAPYLRDGSFARVGDLDHVAQTLYRGYRHKRQGRAGTLDAYVSALPRVRVHATPVPAARLRQGVQLFVRSGCTGCHAFPAFSGLGQHLGRSLFPAVHAGDRVDEVLDTPSLLGVSATAPYLSDGRAPSLSDVLGVHNRADRHGHTRELTAHERASLVTFLESL